MEGNPTHPHRLGYPGHSASFNVTSRVFVYHVFVIKTGYAALTFMAHIRVLHESASQARFPMRMTHRDLGGKFRCVPW